MPDISVSPVSSSASKEPLRKPIPSAAWRPSNPTTLPSSHATQRATYTTGNADIFLKETNESGDAREPTMEPTLRTAYSASGEALDTNLLIVFHGLGDNATNFARFGKGMQLPQTSVLSIQGLFPVPFVGGYGWWRAFTPCGDEIGNDNATVRLDVERVRSMVRAYIREELIGRCGWLPERIFVLGFGSIVIDIACFAGLALGGAVVICGDLLPFHVAILKSSTDKMQRDTHSETQNSQCKPIDRLYRREDGGSDDVVSSTPLLAILGSRDDRLNATRAKEHFAALDLYIRPRVPAGTVHCEVIPNKGHSMPQTAAEMRLIMAFLAQRLVMRTPALEAQGVYEIRTPTPSHSH